VVGVGGLALGLTAPPPVRYSSNVNPSYIKLVGSGLLLGFGSVVYNINQVSLRQAITPHRMQGRMNATMRFMVWGTMPIGSFLGGILGNTIGLRPTLAAAHDGRSNPGSAPLRGRRRPVPSNE